MRNILIIFSLVLLVSCNFRDKNNEYDMDKKEIYFFENESIINIEARTLFNKGLREIQKNNFQNAKDLLEKANKIEKNNPTILNGLGNYEFLHGDKSSSYEILNKVLEIDSTFVLTYINIGQNYMKDRDYKKALEILNEGLRHVAETNIHQKSILYLNSAIASNNLDDCFNGLKSGNQALKYSQNSEFTEMAKTIIEESRKLCDKD